MSVTEAITLPAQPVAGTVDYLPLGGDGFTAPFAAYNIIDFNLTGDASGGRVSNSVNMDMRYCSLVAYFSYAIQQATPAAANMRQVLTADSVAEQSLQGEVPAIDAAIAVRTVSQTWNPTPIVMPGAVSAQNLPRIFARAVNVDGDDYFLNALIYLFNVRVREVTPMGPLLWARGAT